jgi:uncharacterized protein YbcI
MTRTQGEVEAQIGSDLSKFYSVLFDRGPKSIQVNMLPNSAVIITQNNFTAGEKYLISSDNPGRKIFKDMRHGIIAANLAALNAIVENAAGVAVKCMHHDVTPEEEAFVFSLKDRPEYRLNHNGHAFRLRH